MTTKLTEMTGSQIFNWAQKQEGTWGRALEILRDGVVAEVRAEYDAECEKACRETEDACNAGWMPRFAEMRVRAETAEAALAEARREALEKCASHLEMMATLCVFPENKATIRGHVEAVREYIAHHYAPPVPASVRLPLDYADAHSIRITPEMARQIVALAEARQ